jgi:DNA-binding response OmpR family regulator
MNSESTSSLRVLVAEDEPAMLSLVARHMKSLGFSVIEASEGDTAWELAAKHHPDLVILDVMMPGMSGWEICKRLKSDASEGRPFSRTGVIMLTGIGENLNEMTSPLFAADAWLNKPFDFAELDAKVRETLTRYSKPAPQGAREASSGASGDAGARGKSGASSLASLSSASKATTSKDEDQAKPKAGAKPATKKVAVKKNGAPAKKVAAKKSAAPAKSAAPKKSMAPAKKAMPVRAPVKKKTASRGAR